MLKNVQLKNLNGDIINPRTRASLVFNTSNKDLGDVKYGAEVNAVNTVKVNGVPLSVASKAVELSMHDAEYSITPIAGSPQMLMSYTLTKDGNNGEIIIDIPKDAVMQSSELKTCVEVDKPIVGLNVGDMYLDITLANSDGAHVYVSMKSLSDIYTQGLGIVINSSAQVSVDDSIALKGDSLGHYGISDSITKTEMNATFGNMTFEEVSTIIENAINLVQVGTMLPSNKVYGTFCILTDTQGLNPEVFECNGESWTNWFPVGGTYKNILFTDTSTGKKYVIENNLLLECNVVLSATMTRENLPTESVSDGSQAYVTINGVSGFITYENGTWSETPEPTMNVVTPVYIALDTSKYYYVPIE